MSRRRVIVILAALLLSALVATVAYSATSSPGNSGSAPGKQKAAQPQSTEQENESEGQGVPGGTISRFHGGSGVSCALPAGAAALQGNWTHGMFVSAWAATNDSAKIVEAAHSPCGKPTHAAFHGPFGTGLPPGLAKKAGNTPSP
jgi:hypothetical protein